ncbi:IS66 family transposase [Bacillus wiedmannii]|uniref:IS66 family transposase n=1 Tax=Bacillus wiedmannii TaxID=1890302 RepID=UPI003BF4DC94
MLNLVTVYFHNQLNHMISQGTLVHMNRSFGKCLIGFEEQAREHLLQSQVVHFDETEIRVNQNLHWLHTMSTKDRTFKSMHAK